MSLAFHRSGACRISDVSFHTGSASCAIAILLTVTCSRSVPSDVPPPPQQVSASPAPTAEVVVVEPATSSSDLGPLPENSRSPAYGIRCGDQICRPGSQLCCLRQDEQVCITPNGKDRYPECTWGTRACDDSDDCPASMACYPDNLEVAWARCRPLEGIESASYEGCNPDSTCRTPETYCDGEHCKARRPAGVTIPCGAETCGAGQMCCVNRGTESRRCANECEVFELLIMCKDRRDCPRGELCLVAPLGDHVCGKLTHNMGVACASDAECPEIPICQLVCVDGDCQCPE